MTRRSSAQVQKPAGLFSNWASKAFNSKKRGDLRRSPLRAGSVQLESLEVRVLLSVQSNNDTNLGNGTYSVGHDPVTGITTTHDDRAYWDDYVSDLLSGGGDGTLNMSDLVRQFSTPGGSGGINDPQGTVLGNDDRTRVTNTFNWPSSAVVKMYMNFGGSNFIGSGAMISPYHVLTAGHCVYDTTSNAWASSIKVNPGQDGALDDATGNGRWWGEANATYLWSNTGWTVSEDWQHDWGVVTLDRRIGDNTNYFGWQWYSADSAFNGMQVATQGYPGDLQGGEYMYRATGPTSFATPLKVWYGGTMDTAGGQSGSGVWQDVGGALRVVVVHAYGDNGQGNSGTRMTQARWDQLFNSFIATDNSVRAPTDRPDLVNWDDWFGTNISSLSTTSINVGDNLTSNIFTRNNGTASAGAFTVRFRLSTDATYNVGDTFLGDVTINSLGEFEWASTTLTAAIPNVAAGQYRVVYSIDAFGEQVEFNESNNTGAIGTVLNVLPADTNDQISEAVLWFRSQMNAAITGNSIAFAGDVNMHAFTAYAGERLGIDLDRPSGTLDSRLRLFDALGNELANNDDGAAPGEAGSTESYLDYTFATTGTYYLGVSHFANNTTYSPLTGNGDNPNALGTGAYNITFTILNPDTDDQISEATVWARSVIGTTTATAQISIPSDVDMYRIQVVAGETFGFDLDRPSGALDSYLRLFNAAGTQLTFNDDGAGPGEGSSLESYLTYTFTTSGLYYLGVSSYQNSAYNAGTGAGDSFSAITTGDYTLTILNIDFDDQISEALGASIGGTAAGVIDGGLDVDTYAITVAAGQRVYFDIDRNGGSLDSRLRLFDAAGVQLANNDDGVGPGPEFSGLESYIEYTFATAGTYYISVSYFQNGTYSPLTGDGDFTPIVAGVGAYNLNIGFVNQAPVITAATGPAYSIWNDYAYFSGANAFSISDVDAYSGIVEATLTGTNATVTLSSIAGLTFSVGDGTDDDTMTFQGTIADINAALDGMSAYTGSVAFANSTIALNVNDLGNTGIGGAKTASSNVSWWNTIGDFGVAGAGIMRLYGLQTGEDSLLSVVNGVVVGSINGTDYATAVAAVDITEIWIYMRGGDDSFTVDASAAALNVTYINAGGGNDFVDATRLTNGITYGIYGDGGYDTIYGGQGNDVIYLSYYDGGFADGQGGDDTIYGSSVNDSIYGNTGSDYILAYAGDDLIDGGDGFNQIYGEAGNDTIFSGADASAIYGGSENDYISVGSGGNTIYGEGGNDTLIAGAGNDYIDAGTGIDAIDAGGGDDTVLGGADADTIYGGDGNDVLYGGTGDDQYTFNASIAQGSDQVFEYNGEGTSDLLDFFFTDATVNLSIDLRSTAARVISAGLTLQLNSGSNFENVWGGSGNDTIIGNAVANGLWGSNGNDSYFGFQGNDAYYGSEGNDTYNFDADSQLNTDSFLNDDNGIDTINLFATTTTGTTLNLGLFNANQAVNANLSLNISNNTIIENILGTNLIDNYTGNAADNQFDLRDGDDIAVGLAGNDRFIGGVGNDTLTGGNNNDTYVFDADIAQGADTLVEAATLAGGVDTLDFSLTNLTTSNLAIDLRTVGVQAVRAGFVSLSLGASNNFENAIAGAGNDNVFGNNLANSLWGWGGNDLIYGFNANDNLDGGLGNDTYMFDADSNIGSDTVTDAGGTDTLNWLLTTTGASGVTINLASTAAQNLFASGFHTLTLTDGNSIENVIGTNLADNIKGNALNNVLTANAGGDQLEGFAGNDTLIGGADNDIYIFNADNVLGNDLLNESGGGLYDVLSFFDTQVTNLNIDLRIAGYQTVAAGNLSISLQNATAFEWVFGGQANDRIIGNTVNNFLFGYNGNDLIYGQGGNDYLWGGEGNDTLVGEAGRDVIIGGNGADIINGGSEADLIIGGTTAYDFNSVALITIVNIWSGAGTYAARAAAVQAGAFPLNNLTVFNDGAIDQLRGGTGTTDDQLDLFFSSALDTLPDFGTGLELNVVI